MPLVTITRLIFGFLMFLLVSDALAEEYRIVSKMQAVNIAREEATRLGRDVKTLNMNSALLSVPWNECLPKGSTSDYTKMRQKILTGKQYWMISFSRITPKDGGVIKGGRLCFFIDSETGELLASYRGK